MKPANIRRARVAHRQAPSDPFNFSNEPSTLHPTPIVTDPKKSTKSNNKRNQSSAPVVDDDLSDDLLRHLLDNDARGEAIVKKVDQRSSQDDTTTPVVRASKAAERMQTKTSKKQLAMPSESEGHLDSKQTKEEAQRAFLDEQLEKRQLEKLAKRTATERSQSKPQKRARPTSRTRPSASNALKDSFQAYMNEISRQDLLDHSETILLASSIKESIAVESAQISLETELGRRPSVPELSKELSIEPKEVQRRLMAGKAAKNTLVSANLRLVTSVARKVASGKGTYKSGLALEDMIQEGNVGLIKAAEKYDAARGYRFSTYATWWIRAYVMRSISTQSRSIKVPSTIVDEYARIRREYTRFQENGVFKPRDSEVARALGITPAKLRFVVNVVTRVPTSLDISLSRSGDSANSRSLGEIIEGDDHIEERMVEELARKELDEALRGCLRPLERAVIKLRFGLEDGQTRTLRETGALLGLSKERIRQVIFRALPKMKTPEIQRMLTDATARRK